MKKLNYPFVTEEKLGCFINKIIFSAILCRRTIQEDLFNIVKSEVIVKDGLCVVAIRRERERQT